MKDTADGCSAPFSPFSYRLSNSGDPHPTVSPKKVTAAAEKFLKSDRLGYTHAMGIERLRKRIVKHYRETYTSADKDGKPSPLEVRPPPHFSPFSTPALTKEESKTSRERLFASIDAEVHVVLCLDRAGLGGADPRHHGLFGGIPPYLPGRLRRGVRAHLPTICCLAGDPLQPLTRTPSDNLDRLPCLPRQTRDIICVASSGYPCYFNILSVLGAEVLPIPVNSQYKITARELKAFAAKLWETRKRRVKGLILSSPSNPTGALLTPEEVRDLCHYCDAEGIQFISDELYHGITYGDKPVASALSYSDKVIVINSFSKFYS